MAARMAGAVVAVLLASAPGVAAPDGAPLILLPEAADEGATDAIAAPSGSEGSAIGGVPTEAVPAEAAAGDIRAKDGGEAKVPGETHVPETRPPHDAQGSTVSGDSRAGETPDARDSGDMDRAEAAPEPASRLLRALAEAPKASVSRDDGTAGTLRVYAAEGCPRALLRRLLAGAADDAGALTALGIEHEVLTLCRERQEIVTGLFETEARLRELRRASEPAVPARSAAAVVPAPAPAVRERLAPRPAQPSALAAAGTADEADPRAGDTHARDTRAGDTRAGEPQAPARVSPGYAWFSIIGTAGALRAGVTDGTGVWFVREGDALPGGARVAAIAARPPAVRVSPAGGTAEATALPYGALPGGGP